VYQEAECEKEKMDVAYQAQTNIADSSREYQMQKASYDQEVNARKAEAELSYELQVKKILVIFIKQEINCSFFGQKTGKNEVNGKILDLHILALLLTGFSMRANGQ